MNTYQDFSKVFSNFVNFFPMSNGAASEAVQKAGKNVEKASNIVLTAASEIVEINDKWAKDTLERAKSVVASSPTPDNWVKVVQDCASENMEASTQYLSSYTEVARKVQMDAVELVLDSAKAN
ncbi:MAG: hypothetical protein OXC02_09495 [Rhodobacteraceae bacterium]|nr:hypothetical protein [Paracoccaceae bacterium]